jgi:hypothetical protein
LTRSSGKPSGIQHLPLSQNTLRRALSEVNVGRASAELGAKDHAQDGNRSLLADESRRSNRFDVERLQIDNGQVSLND